MTSKFKALFAAFVVIAVSASVVTASASSSRYELESQFHGNAQAR